jgi:F0F1-type ATP synthase membrane subunit a
MLQETELLQLQKIIKQNGVQYYDVQVEFVDHLASEIEVILESNTTLSFENVLQQKIPIWKNEWLHIQQQQAKQLKTKYLRQWKTELMSYITFPKMMLTVILVMLTILIFKLGNYERFASNAIHLLNIVNITYLFGNATIIGKNQQEKKQKLLGLFCLRVCSFYCNIIPIFYLSITLIHLWYDNHSPLPTMVYTFAVAIFPLAVLISLAWRKVNISANLQIRKAYAKAFA